MKPHHNLSIFIAKNRKPVLFIEITGRFEPNTVSVGIHQFFGASTSNTKCIERPLFIHLGSTNGTIGDGLENWAMITTSTCNTLYYVLGLFFDRCFSIHPISDASRLDRYRRSTIIAYLIGPVIINGARFLANWTRMDHVTKRLNVTIEMARFKGGSVRQLKESPKYLIIYECVIHDSVM